MKCDRCGYYNKSENDTCSVCGNPLNKSPVIKYKQKAKKSNENNKTFNTTEKVVIAVCTIAVLMLIASAVIPSDFDFTGMLGNNNNDTQENNPVELNDTNIRIDTQIQVNSAGFGGKDQVIVSAYVNDINNYPVNGGTASITVNGVKYSGNVENGYVNIAVPKFNEEKPQVTVVYEGNDEYNPSEVTTTLEITKISTQIDVEYNNSTIIATLKTANNEKIPDSTVTVLYSNNTSIDKQTDSDGRIILDTNFNSSINSIKLSYAGNRQYNGCEKNIQIENSKMDTKIYADFDDEEKTISLKLVDVKNHPVGDATLDITCNDTKSSQKTDSNGLVEIPVNVGVCKFTIKYAGNDTYTPSETTINTVIEENSTNSTNNTTNDTINNTENATNITSNNTNNTTSNNSSTNITNNTTLNTTNNTTSNTTQNVTSSDNTTQNTTNDTDSSLNNTNNTTQDTVKVNTTIKSKIIKENSTLVIKLVTQDNKAVSNEYVKIILDNGTEITGQTDSDGNIMLDLDDYDDVDKIEFRFLGNEDYAPTDDYVVL